MTDADNGRATIREVYALVSELRADIATVDAKVDALQAQETRLAVLERVCAEQPKICAYRTDEAIRTQVKAAADGAWARVQRWGWLVATVVATASAVIGWAQ